MASEIRNGLQSDVLIHSVFLLPESVASIHVSIHVYIHVSIPVRRSGPLAGVVPPARRRRPAVGAAPDGSPAPAVPGGPG